MSEFILSSIQALLEQRAARQANPLVRPNHSPQELREHVDLSLPETGISQSELLKLSEQLQNLSVNTSSPLFMNQLYGNIHEVGLVGDLLTGILNTSMATYEIAPLLTLIEQEVVQSMGRIVGYDDCEGLLTPGGSLSNMQAMLMAKDRRYPEARTEGAGVLPPLRIFVSDQAHYSFVKFAQLLGLGRKAIVEVASTHKGSMDPEALKAKLAEVKAAGEVPLMIAATAGTTVSGVYDDLVALGHIAQAEKLWYHVDGSYGGSLLMHPETRGLLKGIEMADSVAWNPHKMLGVPFHCPVLMTRHKGALAHSLSTAASYLFHEGDDNYEDDFNTGQKSLHCGRRPEVVKFWLSWKHLGRQGLGQRIHKMVSAARDFAERVENTPHYELLCRPEAPIVCFQYRPEGAEDWSQERLNQFNQALRDRIFAEGQIVLNYAHISDLTVLRCVISSPEFTAEHAQQIMQAVEAASQAELAQQ